jgi:hypothetical protein
MSIKKTKMNLAGLLLLTAMTGISTNGNQMAQWEENPEALSNPSLMTLQEVIDEKAIPIKKEAQTAWRNKRI